jgi:hypothetical protein
MSNAVFAPYEIPTGGAPPPVRLMYGEDPADGRRIVVNRSPWMLLITRRDQKSELLRHGSAAYLPDGDSVRLPESITLPIDAREISRANVRGRAEYWDANLAPRFDEDEESLLSFYAERWWLHRRELDHGRVLHLQENGGELFVTVSTLDMPIFEGEWIYYRNHTAAWHAVLGWNGWGDPPDGWNRHRQSGRRRKDGTPATEYLQVEEGGREFKKRGGW